MSKIKDFLKSPLGTALCAAGRGAGLVGRGAPQQ